MNLTVFQLHFVYKSKQQAGVWLQAVKGTGVGRVALRASIEDYEASYKYYQYYKAIQNLSVLGNEDIANKMQQFIKRRLIRFYLGTHGH